MERHPFDKMLEDLFTGKNINMGDMLGISVERKTPEEMKEMLEKREAEQRKKTEEAMKELAGITGLLNSELKKNKIGFFMRKALLPVFLDHFLGGRD